jgi:transcriptional regulator with XRE-family HTH domain
MRDGDSLLLQRRRLRAELRKARIDQGLTQDQVAKAMDWSLSKVIRIEGTRDSTSSNISTNDLKALLSLYEVDNGERVDELINLARAARVRPWWSAYRDKAPDSLLELIEYESAASVIRHSEALLVPGILQTEDYARNVLEEYYGESAQTSPKGPNYSIAELTDLRTKRRELLAREAAPTSIFRLDEAVLRRVVGSVPVMRAQLQSLVDLSARPNVTIEVIPFSVGLHSGMKGPFEVIEFASSESVDDILFLEIVGNDRISDDPAVTAEYREIFERLGKISLDSQQSVAFIKQAMNQLA